MSLHAIVSGSLYGGPKSGMAKSGRPYAFATLKVRDGDATQWIRLMVFSETAQSELMRLCDGDALSAQGVLKCEIYTSADNIAKISLSVIVDNVLPLRQPPKERRAPPPAPDTRPKAERMCGSWAGPDDGPLDKIPF
jgi:Single-strand binding protein family